MSIVWAVLAFVGGFLLVAGLNFVIVDVIEDRRRQIRERLEEEIRLRQLERARTSMANRDLYELAAEGFVDPDAGMTALDRFRRFVSQSGVSAPPEQIVAVALVLAVVAGALTIVVLRNALATGFVAIIAASIPFLVVSYIRAQRRNKLLLQLPDAYEMMARMLRSGQTITQAMRGVADEFSSPLAEEFAYCWEQQNLGLSPEASFRDLARRTALLEINIFVVAMSIHRQSGGNLVHLLNKLSGVIRDREKIRGKIAALTAEGKLQAYVLLALPIFVALAMSVLNPGYMAELFDYPAVLGAAVVMEILGYLWLNRIVNFDF
jgi:tight adherence protein B